MRATPLKKRMIHSISFIMAFLLLVLCTLSAAGCGKTSDRNPDETTDADTLPPVFEGIHDIEVLQGDGIVYRDGVRAVDVHDGEVTFVVDASNVNKDVPGVYTVTYRAVDAAGNEGVGTATVTVKVREVTYEQLWAVVDPLIEARGFRSLSLEELCTDLYYYIKGRMSYVSDSDKTDWVAEAYRGLTERNGDCFTYYAVARAFFERLDVSVLTVQRAEGFPTTHYWLLVNTGTEESPAWYHWDVCPHPMEYPLTSILLTDEELLAYNSKMADYYTFDQEKYPSTPKESCGE